MAKVSERVEVMKRNFIPLHRDGYLISEIAQKYNLSTTTVYRHLDEIARENGVTRDELLKVIKSPYSERGYKEESERIRVNVSELLNGLEEADNSIQETIDFIDMILKEYDEHDI